MEHIQEPGREHFPRWNALIRKERARQEREGQKKVKDADPKRGRDR